MRDCPECHTTGSVNGVECRRCGGSGEIRTTLNTIEVEAIEHLRHHLVICPDCYGSVNEEGHIVCETCGGLGLITPTLIAIHARYKQDPPTQPILPSPLKLSLSDTTIERISDLVRTVRPIQPIQHVHTASPQIVILLMFLFIVVFVVLMHH
jgi:hypothetical protein